MSTNLMQASKEWATRPDDQRFWTLDEMHQHATKAERESVVADIPVDDLRFSRSDDPNWAVALDLDGTELASFTQERYGNTFARFTHHGFGQICSLLGAPASYLRTLPSETVQDCLTFGARRAEENGVSDRQLLFHANGSMKVRAATSTRYERIWNHEIISRLVDLEGDGWIVPPARPSSMEATRTRSATADDVLDFGTESALTVKEGDKISPAGLYASDHDMFAFMIHPERVIDNGLSPDGMRRGFMVANSEVGDKALWGISFLFDTVCGNHIVWGAEQIHETRIRHIGSDLGERWDAIVSNISDYSDEAAAAQEGQIREAQKVRLGKDRDEVIDWLFSKRLVGKKVAAAAYDTAEKFADTHGDPRTAWGLASGLTRLSQDTDFANSRVTLDLAAGNILREAVGVN